MRPLPFPPLGCPTLPFPTLTTPPLPYTTIASLLSTLHPSPTLPSHPSPIIPLASPTIPYPPHPYPQLSFPTLSYSLISSTPFPHLQYHRRERSNFQVSCVNISIFPRNKASELAWILRGTRRDHADFRASCRKFSRGTREWSRVMHEVCCIYLKIDPFNTAVTRGMRGQPFTCTRCSFTVYHKTFVTLINHFVLF